MLIIGKSLRYYSVYCMGLAWEEDQSGNSETALHSNGDNLLEPKRQQRQAFMTMCDCGLRVR